MNRRTVLQGLTSLAALSLVGGGLHAASPNAPRRAAVQRLKRPESYWRDKVSPAAYEVLFEEDTERAGSSPLNAEKRSGTYVCAACHLPLFDSRHKFESGTGWPSFMQPIAGHMATKTDYKLIWPRTEYHCARCGGHQGHVFDDGPRPRGERWCNNGLALRFVPNGQPLPALRG
jgi:peptide-methionine (R)-S-oxide reductase